MIAQANSTMRYIYIAKTAISRKLVIVVIIIAYDGSARVAQGAVASNDRCEISAVTIA